MDPLIGAVTTVIGLAMIAQWASALARHRVPELETRPVEIRLHLVAEFATAALLIAAGVLLAAGSSIGAPLALFALGMLTYTAVVSPGYFLDRGERGPVVMFAVIVLVALTCAALLVARLST